MKFMISYEEERLIRLAAYEQDRTVSSWVRKIAVDAAKAAKAARAVDLSAVLHEK